MRILSSSLLASLFLIFVSTQALAQDAEVRGTIYDKATGDPIIYGTVVLQPGTTGTKTDVNGYYSITGVEPGTYTITADYLGYDSVSQTITLREGERKLLNLYLKT